MKTYDPQSLLQLLIAARGPSGQEDEVRILCSELIRPLVDTLSIDSTGNLICKLNGKNSDLAPIRIFTHMDEISLIVKRIRDDGSLIVGPLGGIFPFITGQGLVEIMGDRARIYGVLSYGCVHAMSESVRIKKFMPKEKGGAGESVAWEDTYVVTRKTKEQLQSLGVHPGTRVVIAQSRRQLEKVEDCLAGYFMDNRCAIAAVIVALNRLKLCKERPLRDVYFVASIAEEIGAHGACFAARELPGEIALAIDIGPTLAEYDTELTESPIIVYQDSYAIYDKSLCDKLVEIGYDIGIEPQTAVFGSYGSDASIAKRVGQTPKAALVCLPVENSHGFEIIHRDAIDKCAELVAAFLTTSGL